MVTTKVENSRCYHKLLDAPSPCQNCAIFHIEPMMFLSRTAKDPVKQLLEPVLGVHTRREIPPWSGSSPDVPSEPAHAARLQNALLYISLIIWAWSRQSSFEFWVMHSASIHIYLRPRSWSLRVNLVKSMKVGDSSVIGSLFDKVG
jgi:hypothetical protein